MIKKYQFGSPMITGAVCEQISECKIPQEYFTITTTDGIQFNLTMEPEDIVYGLGEANRGINKRGWHYTSSCSDDPNHTENKISLYGAHNFLVLSGTRTFGFFIDYPSSINYDIGFTKQDQLTVTIPEENLMLYIIEGTSIIDIISQFRRMIGKSYAAPKWAFGFQQSRWGYQNADDIREVAKNYRNLNIPLDAIYLDIDYMERYKDFTVDENKFPDFPAFVKEMKEQGIRLVPIIDAGVKIEDDYDIYEEGVKGNYFCKREDGTDFVAGVWPGRTHFPDMLNEDARNWFGKKYEGLISQGIEGFWNDMNEPAIFYSEEGIAEAWSKVKGFQDKNLDINSFFELKDTFSSVSNNLKDYTRFYHNINGTQVRHDKVHNLYGFNMTRAAGEAFDELEPQKRLLLFSRSSYIGMHRYGGIWTGDNQSWWSHLLLNIKMMPSLNMCGFLYTGADMGGFGSDITRDLLLRWTAFSLFTPLMRNHAAAGTRNQECYRFEQPEDFKNLIRLRYALIPYIYSEYMKAVIQDGLLFRPLAFDYTEDNRVKHIEDQLLLGDGLMVAPVYEQNAVGRYVYLPEDMLFLRFRSDTDYDCELMQSGDHYISVALNEVPLFVRKNHLLLLGNGAECIEQLDTTHLTVFGLLSKETNYSLYEDDGFTKEFNKSENFNTIIAALSGTNAAVTAESGNKILSSRIMIQS